jgi:outer membrane protein assembly factor BamB
MPIACQRLPNGHTFIASRQRLVIVDRDGREHFVHTSQTTSIMAAHRRRNGQMALITSGGRCALLDSKGTEVKSFQLAGVSFPLGASIEFLPNGRLLVPLYNQQSVAEFDWTGVKHWSARINRPTSATRLRNGHTLVTCSLDYRIVELDANGNEVWSYRTDGRPYRARRR